MDLAIFSEDFHSPNYGILDAFAQTLLPRNYAAGKKEGREDHWGVKAESYKLNVVERHIRKEKRDVY